MTNNVLDTQLAGDGSSIISAAVINNQGFKAKNAWHLLG
jgi:hypothetical protein